MAQGYGAPPQRSSPHYGLAVGGIITLAGGLLIMLYLGHNYSTCQSFLGQLAQSGSASAQGACSFASGAHWIGLLAAIAGGTLALLGIVRMVSAGTAPSPAPLCQRCGMPLSAHVQGWCPPCQRCGQPFLAHTAGRCPPAPPGGPPPGIMNP